MNIIEAEKLVKKFNGFTAVDGISFSVKRGECFGFLGPNGAGKTTTIKMIQCVSPKSSGKLEVSGMEVDEQPRSIKEKLGVSPQEINLDPDFTVYENLVVFSRFFDISEKQAASRADDLIELFQLQSKRDTSINKLSGGMKRRSLLARSLINDPEILILDEPTIGLDPQTRLRIWDYIKGVNEEGTTIFLTTHYMDEADRLSDRIEIIDHGRIIASGTAESLKNTLGEDMIYLETKDDERAMDAAKRVPEVSQVNRVSSGLELILSADGAKAMPKVLRSIEKDDIGIISVRMKKPSLDDVFVHYTGRQMRDGPVENNVHRRRRH